MRVTFAPRGILQIDEARIVYRNFSGVGSKYNREGDRNFAVVIPSEDIANKLIDNGWNVKIKPARDEDDQPFMFLPVKIKFNERGPAVYVESGSNVRRLAESNVNIIDNIDISSVDMDIRPYEWDVNGKQGKTAYLQSIKIIQQVDRFAERLASEESPEE